MGGMVENKVKVMLVDDSAVVRSMIEKVLTTSPDIKVCGYAADGQQAVKSIKVCQPDIVILDIEMPVMDGLTAIPLLLEACPGVKIIMCSTLSERGAGVSLKALSLGAMDYVLKPKTPADIQPDGNFRREIVSKIVGLGNIKAKPALRNEPVEKGLQLKKAGHLPPKLIAVASSTGGPNALAVFLKDMKNLSVPIIITQHMPPTFTKILAENLSQNLGVDCVEAQDNMPLQAGRIYIAQGGKHMLIASDAEKGSNFIRLNDGPLQNFCKPAADPMLESAGKIYDGRVLAVVLTGMGEDGLKGCRAIVDQGGSVIAQDRETSVVWGMPRAVADAGLCSAVLGLNDIGPYIRRQYSL